MKKKNAVFFYLLGAYVVLQFIWWGYHLIELTKELDSKQSIVSNRVFMIMSEGFVFFTILLIGLWKVRSSIKKELKYSVRQNNFLLSVTHELKTPLAANKLYLQTILKRELDSQKRNELIQKAVSENLRLEVMVDNILNASRIENNAIHLHKEEIDLSQLLNEIASRFNKILQKEVIKPEIEPGISIHGDKFMIETSVNNLLENAIKYAGIEESIYLYLRETEEDEVIFGVKDLGMGVPLKYQEEIFEKFVRNENEETRSQKGTGLGLFITAEFIKIHGGKIAYKDNSPKGANFEIIL